MRLEGRKVMGQEKYVQRMDRHNFSNFWVREAQLHTDHQMVLEVLSG